jgi:hypothetical protein
MRIREQAHLVWRIASENDKKHWKDLHETRYSDPHVYKKGRRLIETQGLLAILRPKCQQIIQDHNASAGRSRLASAPPEPKKTSAVSPKNTASIQRSSNRSDPPNEPSISGNITADHPESEDADDAQSTSDRSCSPPEYIPPKQSLSGHTPVAYPRCRDTAIDFSSMSKSSVEFALPERTPAAHPKSKGDARTRQTSDQSQSSSSSSEHAVVAHPKLEDDARAENTSGQSSSGPQESTLRVQESVTHSTCKKDASSQSTPERSSSTPAPATFERVPVAHLNIKDWVVKKSNYNPHDTSRAALTFQKQAGSGHSSRASNAQNRPRLAEKHATCLLLLAPKRSPVAYLSSTRPMCVLRYGSPNPTCNSLAAPLVFLNYSAPTKICLPCLWRTSQRRQALFAHSVSICLRLRVNR